jgi:hypothetical protein
MEKNPNNHSGNNDRSDWIQKVRREKKEWFDADCDKVLAERNKARMKMLQRKTRNATENFHRKRREAKYLLRRKKREWERNRIQ